MCPLLAALGARLVVRIAPEPAAQMHIDERYAPAALAALAISLSGGVQFRRGSRYGFAFATPDRRCACFLRHDSLMYSR